MTDRKRLMVQYVVMLMLCSNAAGTVIGCNVDSSVNLSDAGGQGRSVDDSDTGDTAEETVLAVTYYVSPDGNGDGASREDPAGLSILRRLVPGDVVAFMDGEYDDADYNLYLRSSGTEESPIVLMADEGAVPVFRGEDDGSRDGVAAMSGRKLSWIVLEGLWFENFGSGGIGLSYTACDNRSLAPDNITIRYCVADMNRRNGIAAYFGSNYTIEHNITSRNGWGTSSWSSNINLYAVTGEDNVVRGNVAFHGIDTSSGQSDGNGYILDVTADQGTALFENNLGFMNGGACIAVTDSAGAALVGNTCYSNAQNGAGYLDEINAGDTCRSEVDCMDLNQSVFTFSGDLTFEDNLLVARSGKDGVNTYISGPCSGSTILNGDNQISVNNGDSVFKDADNADFRLSSTSDDIQSAADVIGFDAKCIKRDAANPTPGYTDFWTMAPDLEYIRSIGGIKHCFHN